MENKDTGLLVVKKDIELQRRYFKEMCRLLGMNVLYRSPIDSKKTWTIHGELDSYYNQPESISCIYEEHPQIKTMKKLGWDAELSEEMSIIHVPYDLKGLQYGALFIIPSPYEDNVGRVFRVVKMSTIQVYPASVSCQIAPEWTNTSDPTKVTDFSNTDFNLLKTEESGIDGENN